MKSDGGHGGENFQSTQCGLMPLCHFTIYYCKKNKLSLFVTIFSLSMWWFWFIIAKRLQPGNFRLVETVGSYFVFAMFAASKNETTNSTIHELKALQKGQSLWKPFLMVYYFLFITLKDILSLAFLFPRHITALKLRELVNWRILGFTNWL